MGKINTSTIVVFISTVLYLFALPAQAKYNGGIGDPCDPYQINDPCQLNTVGANPDDWGKHFILTADVNMSGYSSYTTALIAPDTNSSSGGFQGTAFTGNFDGAGFVISNLTINAAHNDYLGLFGKIEGSNAEVENLGLENVNVSGDYYLGGLCGENYNGIVSNCYSTGSVTGGNWSYYLGGLCGFNFRGGSISNCYSTVSVTSGDRSRKLGGLCGKNHESSISNCYSTGSITSGAYSESFGGLCGSGYGSSISNCYSTGSVSGGDSSKYLSGLCGENWRDTITNCYSTGPVISGDYSEHLGGLCGYNCESSISNCYSTGSVTGWGPLGGLCGCCDGGSINNCYSTGSVTSGGGLCGSWYGGSINNSFWDMDTSGTSTSHGGTGKTTAEMQTQSTFTDASWDFMGERVNGTDDIWRMCVDGIDYPKLSRQFLAGDFVCSDGVDLSDFAVLADTWGLSSGQTGYNDLCDLMDDDVIDLADLAVFAENWLAGK